MRHGYEVDHYILRYCRNGRQLDLGESRSLTLIVLLKLLPASHGLLAYVCASGPGLMVMTVMVIFAIVIMGTVMIAMVTIAMVTVLVMVIILTEVLRQVGVLRQRQHQSFRRLRVFYLPKLSKT